MTVSTNIRKHLINKRPNNFITVKNSIVPFASIYLSSIVSTRINCDIRQNDSLCSIVLFRLLKLRIVISIYFHFTGGLDKIRHEDNPSDPHAHGDAEPSPLRNPQRTQHLEAVHQQCGAQGLGHLHVPDQYRSDDESG